jgi:hypothetical protein
MAIGTQSTFVLYDEQFWGGFWEKISQMIDGFNQASANSIRMIRQDLKGEYDRESFIQRLAGLDQRRDPTATGPITPLSMSQDERIGVKLNRRIGPVEDTLDRWLKIGDSPETMSFIIGQMAAEEAAASMLNRGLIAVTTAIAGVAALNFDATAETTKTLKAQWLHRASALLGDRATSLVAWVMHSKPWFDMGEDQLTSNVTGIANVVIYGGTPGTLGLPVLVTDSPSLVNAGSTPTYETLGLVSDAVVVTESQERQLASETKTGGENLTISWQAEYAFNVRPKGFKWDIASGGPNPTDAALGTTTNWDQVVTDIKDCAGVRVLTEGS